MSAASRESVDRKGACRRDRSARTRCITLHARTRTTPCASCLGSLHSCSLHHASPLKAVTGSAAHAIIPPPPPQTSRPVPKIPPSYPQPPSNVPVLRSGPTKSSGNSSPPSTASSCAKTKPPSLQRRSRSRLQQRRPALFLLHHRHPDPSCWVPESLFPTFYCGPSWSACVQWNTTGPFRCRWAHLASTLLLPGVLRAVQTKAWWLPNRTGNFSSRATDPMRPEASQAKLDYTSINSFRNLAFREEGLFYIDWLS